ncbi:hypothetical protein VTH06DRAFT_2899, partial [Thermothelomyces fergusii]
PHRGPDRRGRGPRPGRRRCGRRWQRGGELGGEARPGREPAAAGVRLGGEGRHGSVRSSDRGTELWKVGRVWGSTECRQLRICVLHL